jgi:hypothetical protein
MNLCYSPRSLVQRPETGHEAHSNTDAPKDGNGPFKQSPDKNNDPNDCQYESSEHEARTHVVALVQQEHQSDCTLLRINLGAITIVQHLPSVVE